MGQSSEAKQRWNIRVNLAERAIFTGAPNGYATPFRELPPPSDRVALLLDRFKRGAVVLDCSNDSIFPPETIFKQDLFQFMPHELDRGNLTRTLDLVKRWITTGVDGPAAGPFATCRFTLHIPPQYVLSLHHTSIRNLLVRQSSSAETGRRDSYSDLRCHLACLDHLPSCLVSSSRVESSRYDMYHLALPNCIYRRPWLGMHSGVGESYEPVQGQAPKFNP